MDLPEEIVLTIDFFGDGENGAATQQYTNRMYGVTMLARREHGHAAFVEKWTMAAMPDKDFPSYEALREAAKDVTP